MKATGSCLFAAKHLLRNRTAEGVHVSGVAPKRHSTGIPASSRRDLSKTPHIDEWPSLMVHFGSSGSGFSG